MTLFVNFGLNGTKKQVTWHKPLMDFPKLIRFQGSCWEWAIYNNMGNDYELTFQKSLLTIQVTMLKCPLLKLCLNGTLVATNAECGAIHTIFRF